MNLDVIFLKDGRPGLIEPEDKGALFMFLMRKQKRISLPTGIYKNIRGHLSKKLKTEILLYSYMDDIYPSMNIRYTQPLSSAIDIYVYGSVIIGILGTVGLLFSKESHRIHRITKRKNTDESPILQV